MGGVRSDLVLFFGSWVLKSIKKSFNNEDGEKDFVIVLVFIYLVEFFFSLVVFI